MKIKELEKPNLDTVKMKCDNVISNKLLKYPMVSDCFSKTSFTIIVGKPGSGKTSLLLSLLSSKKIFKKTFHTIFCAIPSASLNSIEKNIFEKLPPDQLFEDLTIELLEELYTRSQENAENDYNSILVIDDLQSILKDVAIAKGLEKLIIKRRHIHLTIFLLNQNYGKLPRPLRLLATNIIAFDIGKIQFSQIFEEHIDINKNMYDQIINFVFSGNKHEWLCINTVSKRLYKMFDEVILE
jgi:DNA replication protein DnaC